jgi:hypothetical protein
MHRWWWVPVAVALAVIAVAAFAWWRATHLDWAEVMAAVAKQKTINAVGRMYGDDGSEWAAAVWVRVDAPDFFPSNQMLLPVKTRPKQQPGPEVVALGRAANYPAQIGSPALASGETVQRVRAVEWKGKLTQKVESHFFASCPGGDMTIDGKPGHLSLARLYFDPDTKLVIAAEFFSGKTAHATVEYSYNKPLPSGFRPQ